VGRKAFAMAAIRLFEGVSLAHTRLERLKVMELQRMFDSLGARGWLLLGALWRRLRSASLTPHPIKGPER